MTSSPKPLDSNRGPDPINALQTQLEQLELEKADLEIMLENIVEHSNDLEEQVYQQNEELQVAERHVRQLNTELEARVRQRTAELEAANRDLARESAERKQAQEEALRLTQQLLEQQLRTIEQTYEAVHNGPLQELAVLLRSDLGDIAPDQLRARLVRLNEDLRGIYLSMRAAASSRRQEFFLEGGLGLSIAQPLPDLLAQVFDHTLERDFPGFETIRFQITPDFTPLVTAALTDAQKRGICLFLQEALCNIGKHALGTTRIEVICDGPSGTGDRGSDDYCMRVMDNGPGLTATPSGSDQQGTHQARALAQQLKGQFRRQTRHPQGVCCELIWPASSPA